MPKDETLQAAQIELIRSPVEVMNESGQKVNLDASEDIFPRDWRDISGRLVVFVSGLRVH